MIRKKEHLLVLILLCVIWTNGQNSICYSNCRQGYCTETSPRVCTSCDLGQVNINGKCIAGSSQPYPITFLTINQSDQLEGSLAESKTFTCTVTNTSIFNQRVMGSLVYEIVPGTTYTKQFTIPQRHQYIQIKFNAAIVQSTTVFLEYELLAADGTDIFSSRIPNNPPSDQTLSISCLNQITVRNVFFVRNSVASSENIVTLQVKSLDANAVFGVSNIEVYYGSCHAKCKTCTGPSQFQCLSCQGLYMRLLNGTCQVCPIGFYDAGNQCRVCPAHCQSCALNNITKTVFCNSCLAYAQISVGTCITKYEYYALPASLIYQNADGWTSSELSTQPLTLCGRYSLIGGISIGRQGSSLSKTFSNLEVHSQVEIHFTFLMIDQQLDQKNLYQIFIDGILVQQKQFNITAQQGIWTLSDQCGNSNPELSFIVSLKKIPHNNRDLMVSIKSYKNWFGIRDFNLIVNNKTGVKGCFEEKNGNCISCVNGFKYDQTNKACSICSQGYYLHINQCLNCPIQCKGCHYDYANTGLKCTSCPAHLILTNGQCKDTTKSIYLRQIIPSTLKAQNNLWTLYPKLPQKGLTTCGGTTILGASQVKYKFLTMKRQFNNIPTHLGVKVYFQFYQIDLYANDSVHFVFNGKKIPYVPTKERREICGDQKQGDAVVKIQLQDDRHTDGTLIFQVQVNGKVKLGINNFILFLLGCQGCNNQVDFKLQQIPVYSLSTPPQKGVQVKLIFDEKIYNKTPISQAFKFSLSDPSAEIISNKNNKLNKESRNLQGLIQFNENLPIVWQQIVANRQYRSFLALHQDYNQNSITADPVSAWQLTTNSQEAGRSKVLSSMAVSKKMPRYINIDQNNIDNRKNMRNLRNLFQGCAIFALWIGLISFIFGLSSAFDDFFILMQVIFVHIFIQLAYSPPSFRLPLQGMQIVQFMAWLPWQARVQIQKGIIAKDLYQKSPIQYEQYYQDIVFARTIYHTILFLAFMIILFILLKLFDHIVSISEKSRAKYSDNYFVKYYGDYQAHRFAYIDKAMRFAYFTVVWACTLQFIQFQNSPRSFNIWNSVLCIVMFVIFVLYPIAGFYYLHRASRTISQTTFDRNYQQVRVKSERLFHFIWRYYKLLLIALLIGLIYSGNPLAILIPIIVMHVVDGIMIIALKPFGMVEQANQLNVKFYNKYPQVYTITSAIQSFLFAFLQLFILISYAVRDESSNYSYLGLGYTCCAIVIALLVNGLVRLAWGFIKIVQGCFSKSREMKLQVQKKMQKQKQHHEEMVPMKSAKQIQTNINSLQSRSRMNTARKQSYVSKIS